MDIMVRRARVEDAEIVALLGRVTFAETFGYLFRDHADDLRAYLDRTFGVAKIRAGLGKQGNAFWLALADGLPVGYAKRKQPSPLPALARPDAAQLQKIYVLRAFIGQGIGARLLDAVLDGAASAVWLAVLQENRRAVEFYRDRGFADSGTDRFTIGAQTFVFLLMARLSA